MDWLGALGTALFKNQVRYQWLTISVLLFNLNVVLVLDVIGFARFFPEGLGLSSLTFNWFGNSSPLAFHSTDPLPLDVGSKLRTKPVPPQPNCLMAGINSSLEQQVFNVSQRKRIPHV